MGVSELHDVLASARAWLQWEEDLGATGIAADLIRAPDLSPSGEGTDCAAAACAIPSEQVAAVAGPDQAPLTLAVLNAHVQSCTHCDLSRARSTTVFARGSSAYAKVVFVGDAPTAADERGGRPFSGDAGELLDKMISAMGLSDASVHICNLVKCRPPADRPPRAEEVLACSGHLRAQLQLVRPAALVALGETAARTLGGAGAKEWRGHWQQWEGIPVMPTYHPVFLLQSPALKRDAWADLQKVMGKLQLVAPTR